MVPGEARKVKSGRQDETVLQKACNNLNSQWQSTWMGDSSNIHRPLKHVIENGKPKTHPIFTLARLSHYFKFYFFDYTIDVVRLFFICITPFANFLFKCLSHFSTKIFVISLLICEGSLYSKALNPLLYIAKTFPVVGLNEGQAVHVCMYTSKS